MFHRLPIPAGILAAVIQFTVSGFTANAEDRTIRLEVVDAESGRQIAARVYLMSAEKKPYYFRAGEEGGTAVRYEKQNWINSESVEYHTTVSAHRCVATVPPGQYTLTVERGKAYLPVTRRIEIVDSDVRLRVPLTKWIDMSRRGWYSGDTHVHRHVDDLCNIVLAEDLNVVFPLTNWVTISDTPPVAGDKNIENGNNGRLVHVDDQHVIWSLNTEYEIFTVGDKRHTLGALFVLGHQTSIHETVPPWKPVVDRVLEDDHGVLFDLDKLDWPFAMVLPTIVPNALYELANNHFWRSEFALRSWNSRAPAYMQPPFGASEGGERQWLDYTLGMYYTLLNCGFRLPPSAGTANGVHPVPAGFGRVYVHLPDGFDYADWCRGLHMGRSFVTTGPMIFATADGHDPGHVFHWRSQEFEKVEIPVHIEVVSETPLQFGEIVINGVPEHLLRARNEQTSDGAYRCALDMRIAPRRSGWFAIRFFEERPNGRIRFAHTAPWYVEIDEQPVRLFSYEKQYLVRRMNDEIQRSRGIVSADALEEYERARHFYETLPVHDDSDYVARNARPFTSEVDKQRWLDNMIVHHRFSADEVRWAMGLSREDALREVRQRSVIQSQQDTDDSGIRILPYPGGRHPRRGFLDGAIDPQRETKFSVFPPWRDGGYVVVDVPEAIFSNLGLTYLAHTHVPTIWTAKEVELPKLEWEREGDSLTSKRVLPNGITFGSRVERGSDAVKMEMWLTNRSVAPLTGLRTQVCVMLKGAIGFNSQMSLPRVIQEPFIAVRSENSDRWIITAWNSRSRVWSNPPVPCIHSDPFFSDCAPGETVRVHGGLWFYEGKDVERELDRLAQSWDDGNRLKD